MTEVTHRGCSLNASEDAGELNQTNWPKPPRWGGVLNTARNYFHPKRCYYWIFITIDDGLNRSDKIRQSWRTELWTV